VYETWAEQSWKKRCRIRINSCSRFVALFSRQSLNAPGQRWAIACAADLEVPILGVHLSRDDLANPPEINGKRRIYWDESEIARFIGG
jgi:hypothetical protein